MPDQAPAYEGWAIVEVFGHRRYAGYVRPVTQYGTEMARIDTPEVDDQAPRSQYVGGGSIFMLHPCEEAIARIAARSMPEPPVARWELPQTAPTGDDIGGAVSWTTADEDMDDDPDMG